MLDLFNPKYKFEVSKNNEKYLIDLESQVIIDLNSSFDNILSANITISKANILLTIHKVKPDGMLSYEEERVFDDLTKAKEYLLSWKDHFP